MRVRVRVRVSVRVRVRVGVRVRARARVGVRVRVRVRVRVSRPLPNQQAVAQVECVGLPRPEGARALGDAHRSVQQHAELPAPGRRVPLRCGGALVRVRVRVRVRLTLTLTQG